MKLKWGLIFIFLVVLATVAQATGINVYINKGSFKDVKGAVLPDVDYLPYKDKLEFFTTLPAPNSSAGRLALDLAAQYTILGNQNKYQYSSLNGGTFYVRIWKGAPITPGSYYGKTSNPIASGTTLPYDFTISSLQTTYKADAPYQPFIFNISETSDHPYDSSGTAKTTSSTLKISSQQGTGSDGEREVKSIDWWYGLENPPKTPRVAEGATLSLKQADLVPGATYYFQTVYNGYFGSPSASNILGYQLGSGGVGGVTSLTVTLRKVIDGFGVNSVGIPFAPPFDVYKADGQTKIGNQVLTLGGLIEAINKTEAKVTAASFWDARVQKLRGVAYESQQEKYLTEDTATYPSITTAPNIASSPDDSNPMSGRFAPAGWNLAAGKGYYISVDKEVTIILKK